MAFPFSQKNKFWRKLRYWIYHRSPRTKIDLLIVALAILLGCFTFVTLTGNSHFIKDPQTVIYLLNANILVLLALSVIIAGRMYTLWINRKKRAAASKLHTQLVLTFGILAALPAIIMTIFSASFFHFGIQNWFSDRVKGAINNSIAVAQAYLQEHQNGIKADGIALSSDFEREYGFLLADNERLKRFIGTQSFIRNLPEIALFREDGHVVVRTEPTEDFDPEKYRASWERPDHIDDSRRAILLSDEASERVRAVVPVRTVNENLYFYVSRAVDEKVLDYLATAQRAEEDYFALEKRSSAFQLTITLIFITISLLLVLSAIWIGLLIARRLIKPIAALIEATEKVAAGDLTAQVLDRDENQIDEFKTLAVAFNTMTDELHRQRQDLIKANAQINERRKFIETVFSGVSAGIINVNKELKIQLSNENASTLLGMTGRQLKNRKVSSIFPDLEKALRDWIEMPALHKADNLLKFEEEYQHKKFLVRAALISNEHGRESFIITFDDITELEDAQKKAAWADVARRIAHEIKNPLTPIQLATERLSQKYQKLITDPSEQEKFQSYTATILRHVSDIQNMVNEFSDFARMPEAKKLPTDIVQFCHDLFVFQQEAFPALAFIFENRFKERSEIMLDRNLFHQALTNIIKNAAESIEETGASGKIMMQLKKTKHNLHIEILDNGKGLPDAGKNILDPYVTTKDKGTGLGLAIVKKIVEEHQGVLSIKNMSSQQYKRLGFASGVAVIIQLPLK